MTQDKIHWPRDQHLVAKCVYRQPGDQIKTGLIECHPKIHGSVPDPHCTCGIYARYDPTDLGEYVTDTGICVIGAVDCFGTIHHGENGLRAEKARVVALVPRDTLDWKLAKSTGYYKSGIFSVHQAAQMVANVYRVPLFATVKQMLKEYPMENISDLPKSEPRTPEPPCNLPNCPICSPVMPGGVIVPPNLIPDGLYFLNGKHLIVSYDPATNVTTVIERDPQTGNSLQYTMMGNYRPLTTFTTTTTTTNTTSSFNWRNFLKNIGA